MESGHVYSQYGNEIALPVLEFKEMNPANDFSAGYHLEKFPLFSLIHEWPSLAWTKKIPLELKNRHREFWGMSKLKKGKDFEYLFTADGKIKIREVK
jgi:hypothetical protein